MHKIFTFVIQYSKYAPEGWSLSSMFSFLNHFRQLVLFANHSDCVSRGREAAQHTGLLLGECMSQKVEWKALVPQAQTGVGA